MSRRSVALLISLLLLSGPILIVFLTQSPGERLEGKLMRKWTPPDDVAMVQKWVEWLRDGNFDQIEQGIDPSLRTDDLRDKLNTMAGFVPAQQPRSVKPIGYLVVNHRDSSRTVTATLEYEFPDHWLLATLVRQEQSGTSTVTGFHVNPIPESVERHNRFTFSGRRAGALCRALVGFRVSCSMHLRRRGVLPHSDGQKKMALGARMPRRCRETCHQLDNGSNRIHADVDWVSAVGRCYGSPVQPVDGLHLASSWSGVASHPERPADPHTSSTGASTGSSPNAAYELTLSLDTGDYDSRPDSASRHQRTPSIAAATSSLNSSALCSAPFILTISSSREAI